AALAAEPRRALPAQPLDRAVLGSGRDAQLLGPRQGRNVDGRAADRLGAGDRALGLHVPALARADRRGAHAPDHLEVARRPAAGAAGAAEEVGQDVAEAAGERSGVEAAEAARPTGRRERPRPAVVLLALLGVGEDVVGLGDLLEALLGPLVARVAVGVVLARELAVGLLDLIRRRVLRHTERLVVVGATAHGSLRHDDASGGQHGALEPAA